MYAQTKQKNTRDTGVWRAACAAILYLQVYIWALLHVYFLSWSLCIRLRYVVPRCQVLRFVAKCTYGLRNQGMFKRPQERKAESITPKTSPLQPEKSDRRQASGPALVHVPGAPFAAVKGFHFQGGLGGPRLKFRARTFRVRFVGFVGSGLSLWSSVSESVKPVR